MKIGKQIKKLKCPRVPGDHPCARCPPFILLNPFSILLPPCTVPLEAYLHGLHQPASLPPAPSQVWPVGGAGRRQTAKQKGKFGAFSTSVPSWLGCRSLLSWRPLSGGPFLQLEFWPPLLSPAPPGPGVPTIASGGTYPSLVTSLTPSTLCKWFL